MPKVELEILGKDSASGAVKGLIGSLVSANAITDAYRATVDFLKDTINKGIEAFKEGDLVVQALKDTVGGSVDQYLKFASSIQKVTTIEDEAVISAMKFGLQMGISKDAIEEATQGAIGLSKAFGIDLNTSIRMVAMAEEGNYKMLQRYIPELKNAETEAEKQAIVQQKMADGFKIATGEAETFTGKLMQLENAQGDIYENVGQIVSVVGKDFVDAMIDGANAINDFLASSENIATIGAGFKVTEAIVKDLGTQAFEELKIAVEPLTDLFTELTAGMDIDTFEAIGIAVNLLSVGLSLLAGFVRLQIQLWIDLVKAGIEASKIVQTFWDVLFQRKSFKDLVDQASLTGEAIKGLATNFTDNTGAIIKTATEKFDTFTAKSEETAKRLEDIYTKSKKKIKDELDNPMSSPKINTDGTEEDLEEIYLAVEITKRRSSLTWSELSEEMYDTWEDGFDKMSKSDKMKEMTGKIKEWGGVIINLANEIVGTLKQVWDSYYKENLGIVSDWKEESLKEVEDWEEEELENAGVQTETKAENLQTQIEDLQNKLAKETDEEKKADIKQQINEKQDELTREKILEEGEKKRDKIREEAKAKETELKKKQFEENKAWQIANIWINAATATMGWWASFASMGVAGIVLAAAMTVATLVMAGAQTGIVASQTFHGQEGGIIPTGGITGDNTVLYGNKGEALLRNDDYRALVGMAREERGGNGDINIYGDINVYTSSPENFASQLRDLRRYERVRS